MPGKNGAFEFGTGLLYDIISPDRDGVGRCLGDPRYGEEGRGSIWAKTTR
jgi:hypothetical protein